MYQLLLHGSVENIPYYNCSGKTEEQWFATGRKRPLMGWTILLFGIFVEILYLPTIFLMFKTKLVRLSCYKIIILLGFTDMITTVVSSIISGILFIKGAVYCNYPTLIYISGSLGFSGWCCACGCTLVLVLNRVGDFLYRPLTDFLFEGKRIFFSIAVIILYWIGTAFFTPPILFNSEFMAWIADPLVMDNPPPEALNAYFNHLQKYNNWIFAMATCSLYAFYCALVNKMQHGQKSKASRQVFLQSSIICFFNTFTAITYNVMLMFETPTWVVCFGELCWSGVHGVPAIIYITMNKTIRHEFLKMIGLKSKESFLNNTVHFHSGIPNTLDSHSKVLSH